MATCVWTGAVSGNWATAGNWVGGVVPADGDDVWFIDNDRDLNEGLDTQDTELANLYVDMTYTGKIGTEGSFLILDTDNVWIGRHDGLNAPMGSPMWKIDLGSTAATAVTIYETARTGIGNYYPLRLLTNHANNTIKIYDGVVAIEEQPGDVGQCSQIDVGSSTTSPVVLTGSGLTCATFNWWSGDNRSRSASTTESIYSGDTVHESTDPKTAVNAYGGTLYIDNCGAITNLYLKAGMVDTTRTRNILTINTATLYPGGGIRYKPSDAILKPSPDYFQSIKCMVI